MAVIAVDLISTGLTSAAISIAGKVLHKEIISLDKREGKEVSLLIQTQVKRLLKIYENEPIQIKAIGISVPGISYSKTGTVWAPNIPGWEDYPLLEDVSNLVKGRNLKIRIGSNRTCYILGEYWQGAARKSKNAIYLAVGNGIGAGLLIDGKILHGFNDGVGAVGWMTLGLPYKNIYQEKGSFETQASWIGILRNIEEQISKSKNYKDSLASKDINNLSIYDVFNAYKLKDKIVVKVLKNAVVLWGMAVANLVSLFNPEIFIFGGPVFGPALEFIDSIKTEALKWAQPHNIEKVQFLGSELGTNAGLFGAGQLATGKF